MKRIKATFYRTETGKEPVKEWISDLADDDRKTVGKDIAKVEFGWPIGMPICRPLGSDVAEVRSTIKAGRVEARVYFAIDGSLMILLHGHEGKGGQDQEIELARSRWRDYKRRKAELAKQAKKGLRDG